MGGSGVVPLIDAERGAAIRTPDQRLRVFVSSTLGELAPERAAVRTAIERMRLTPVMFELGARAHPPRALYRAYLDQSDIFVGLYWQSYGWVAPETTVSGIEDEYELASGMPCLVYLKDPAPEREARLEAFLVRITADERVSYKRFRTAEQLGDLLADDLALLLTEHFVAPPAVPESATVSTLRPRPLPVAPTRLVGRERDVEAVCDVLRSADVRLLTLTGVGGIGKTRLALAAGARLDARFSDGVGFADLSFIRDPELVASAVAAAIGVPQAGTRPVADLLVERLADAELLLIIDNFEHVLAAAPLVSRLLAGCPRVRALVTSRALLRLRGEHEFAVKPLQVPSPSGAADDGALSAAAVRLFIERAREHLPRFVPEDREAPAVVELCRRLEGIPLAIELAAARIRVLPPTALLERIADRLDLLSGPSDLPERQRTLRAAIDWSYDLLSRPEQDLFAELSVCVGGFTLEGADAICAREGADDVLAGVSSLIEKSLVVPQERPEVEPRFRMLETVREYAQDRLARTGKLHDAQLRLARHLAGLSERAAAGLSSSEHRIWLARLNADADNMRAAIAWALKNEEPELFLALTALPWIYWWQTGSVPQMRPLFEQFLASHASLDPGSHALELHAVAFARVIGGDPEAALPLLRELMDMERARGDDHWLAIAQWSYYSQSLAEPVADRRAALTEAAATLRRVGDRWMASFALTTLSALALLDGDVGEAERLGREALDEAEAIDSESAIGVALSPLGYAALARGDADLARTRFADGAHAFQHVRDREGFTYALDGLGAVALAKGVPELAAKTIGATDATRKRIGVGVYPLVERTFRSGFVSAVEATLGSASFEAARSAGDDADPDELVEELLRLTA